MRVSIMDLADLVTSRRERIIERWVRTVGGTLHPAAMPRLELIDHLPTFLDEVAAALRRSETPDTSETAADHGLQRLALGFSLDSVVREYGALRDCINAEAAEQAVVIATRQRETLFGCIITGIAEAVSEYQRQRDAELQRQMAEHFAFIAHELRNPLGSAVTALGLLRDGKKIKDERLADFVHRSLTRMRDVVERSLSLAQIGSGITVVREEVMLRTVLEDAQLAAGADAEAKQVDVAVHLERDEPVCVDVRLVHSALTNLVRNAVKFTHAASVVQVRAEVTGGRVTIEVEDRCGGWAAGTAERAFGAFVQVGTDRSGYGLGLAIAKQAADAHGGSIRIQNLPGRGCIFVLELPVR